MNWSGAFTENSTFYVEQFTIKYCCLTYSNRFHGMSCPRVLHLCQCVCVCFFLHSLATIRMLCDQVNSSWENNDKVNAIMCAAPLTWAHLQRLHYKSIVCVCVCCVPFSFAMKVTFCRGCSNVFTVCTTQAWIPVVKTLALFYSRPPLRFNSIQFNAVEANDPHIVIDKHSVTTGTQWIWQSAAHKKLSIVHSEASSLRSMGLSVCVCERSIRLVECAGTWYNYALAKQCERRL